MNYINNLGEFDSLADVWKEYPHGGKEGDYVVINGVNVAWNKYTTNWGADTEMPDVNNEVNGDFIVKRDLRVGGEIINKDLKWIKGATVLNKGYFKTVDDLKRSCPAATVGSKAYVGSDYPYAIYLWDGKNAVWVDSGEYFDDSLRNKGYFATVEALQAAYPIAVSGSKAYVGVTYPFAIYLWDATASTWVDSGETGGEESVNLGDYYTKEETDAKVAELDSETIKRLTLNIGNDFVFFNDTISSIWGSSNYEALIPIVGYDCILIKTDNRDIVVQNAVPSQFVFYDRMPVSGKSDGYIKYNTSGKYVAGAKYCVINFAHEANSNGYADIVINTDYALEKLYDELKWKVVLIELKSNIAAEINQLPEGTFFLNTYSNTLGVRVGERGWEDREYKKNELYIIQGTPYYFDGESLKALLKQEDKWANKKWVCVGDSLTEINSRTTKHYFDYISDVTGISVINMGVGGTGYMDEQDDNNAFYQRILNIDTSADVITIFGSGNDLSHPLGNITDVGTDTVCGCINKTLDNLFQVYPLANVGIITPTPWGWYPPHITENNKMANYSQALVDICNRRGIPCLDLYHCSGLRPWDESYLPLCYSKDDGNSVHPDEQGHKIISTKIQAFLQRLLLVA